VGVALHLRHDPLHVLLEAARRFGELVFLGHCPRPLYLINHPTLIQQILEQPASYTKGPSVTRILPLFGTGLTTSDGALWRHQRPLLTAAWQAQQAAVPRVVAAATTAMLARWHAHAQNGQALDLTAALEDVTWTIMLRVLFGPETPDPGPGVQAAMQTALAATNRRIWTLWAPPLAFPTRQNRCLRQARHTLETFVHQQLTMRRQQGERPAALAARLAAMPQEGTGEAMPSPQVRDEVLTLWVAGHTTMAAALAWTWLVLDQHPAVAARVQEEVHQVRWEDLRTAPTGHTLPYTRLVIAEALRLYPPTWVTARTPVGAVDLGGCTIPAGAVLLLSPYTMQRHPAFWEAPERYEPERFLRERALGRPRYAYFPFGGGPRLCLGRGQALQALQMIIALMVRTYRLRLVPGPPVWPAPTLTLRPSRALWCTVGHCQVNENP
jgi:cytochrome P450